MQEALKIIRNAPKCRKCGDVVDWPKKFCDVACESEYLKLENKVQRLERLIYGDCFIS